MMLYVGFFTCKVSHVIVQLSNGVTSPWLKPLLIYNNVLVFFLFECDMHVLAFSHLWMALLDILCTPLLYVSNECMAYT